LFAGLAVCVFVLAAPSLPVQRLAGRDCVAVPDIIRAYNAGNAITARADRRYITVAGVNHWLTTPVVASRSRLWITQTDLLKTVDPVLRSRRPPGVPARVIVLDPGHGGSDRGTRGRTAREKTLTLDLAQRVRRYLAGSGARVLLTRATDRAVSLESRSDFARASRADLFVSIHFNSGGSASGIETYCLPPAGASSTSASWWRRLSGEFNAGNRFDADNAWLAHCVQAALLRGTRTEDRGVRRARFQVLRDASCPAILVEAGFLSNVTEERRILTVEYRERLAKAIADGIVAYRKTAD